MLNSTHMSTLFRYSNNQLKGMALDHKKHELNVFTVTDEKLTHLK